MKIRHATKHALLPFGGPSTQVFYDFVLYEDSSAYLYVPLLGKDFEGGAVEIQAQAIREISEEVSRRTGRPVEIERAAMTVAWQKEERASIGLSSHVRSEEPKQVALAL